MKRKAGEKKDKEKESEKVDFLAPATKKTKNNPPASTDKKRKREDSVPVDQKQQEKIKKRKEDTEDAVPKSAMEQLPPEIKTLIFSCLDEKALSTAGLTCREWNNLSQDGWVWKEKIKQRFSYLVETHQNEYVNSPKELYRREYEHYQNLIKSKKYLFSMQQLLDALSGNLREIMSDDDLPENNKQALYAYAVANGHHHALKHLSRKNKGMALRIVAEMGHLPAVKQLLNIDQDVLSENIVGDPEIPAFQIDQTFIDAAKRGQLLVMQLLLKYRPSISYGKGRALFFAAEKGHLHVVQYLLQEVKDISLHDIGLAFHSAAKNGHIDVVQCFLEHVQDIPIEDKALAFSEAAKQGQHHVVLYLLGQVQDLSPDDKGWALGYAAEAGHLHVVQYLLEHAPDISIRHRNAAIDLARSNHPEIAEFIQNNIEQARAGCSIK